MRLRRTISRAVSGRRRHAAALIIALVTLLIITSTMASIVHSLLVDLRQTRQAANELQAHWLADSAVGRAAAQLRANGEYEGETWRPVVADENEGRGVAEIRTKRGESLGSQESGGRLNIVVDARYPDHPWRRVVTRRTILLSPAKNYSAADQNPQESAP